MPLDAAHVHLMLNHLLVVGLAVATGLVYLSGEPAEELVDWPTRRSRFGAGPGPLSGCRASPGARSP
jgi:hypothetical protein